MNYRKLLMVMVGLPARGKSYISIKTCSYVNWLGMKAQIFNAGKHRRLKRLSVTQVRGQDIIPRGRETRARLS